MIDQIGRVLTLWALLLSGSVLLVWLYLTIVILDSLASVGLPGFIYLLVATTLLV